MPPSSIPHVLPFLTVKDPPPLTPFATPGSSASDTPETSRRGRGGVRESPKTLSVVILGLDPRIQSAIQARRYGCPGRRPDHAAENPGGDGRRVSASGRDFGRLIRSRQSASSRVSRGCRGGHGLTGHETGPRAISGARPARAIVFIPREASRQRGLSEVKRSAAVAPEFIPFRRHHGMDARIKSGHDEGRDLSD